MIVEQWLNYSEQDAKTVLIKHQHKVTRQRVGVLFFLMRCRKAFTFKQLSDALVETSDRVTIYRTLNAFVSRGIVGKALNEKGTACFFYLDHLKENKRTHTYLQCKHCEEVIGLPSLPDQYLNILSTHNVTPTSLLMTGDCNRPECLPNPE